MFLPTTKEEAGSRGWDRLDVILISGDAYIDTPYNGTAVIGNVLADRGYRVGVIAQPDIGGNEIARLGEPALYWGISGGSVDSMVSNYTALKKRRMRDDLTPGGKNTRRPDRALIVYANLIRKHFKNTAPIVLGGIEASLRRIAHYDFWSDSIRRSVLFDAKADILAYGMAEEQAVSLAGKIKNGGDFRDLRGICYISNEIKNGYAELPPYETVSENKESFIGMFKIFYSNCDPSSANGLVQKHGGRWLVHNPPEFPPTQGALDRVYNLPYERGLHPYYQKDGAVRALETVKFSITTHRGCAGECNFCSIALHQGRRIVSRSEESILREAEELAKHPAFKGIIYDLGGPTANMYGMGCRKKTLCADRRCLYPFVCGAFNANHARQVTLLGRLRKITGVKKIFIGSGIRHDLVMNDKAAGTEYLGEIISHHISGQIKVAPEHSEETVLARMGKPSIKLLRRFMKLFRGLNKKLGKKQFLTYYFIAAHPGCGYGEMAHLKKFIREELKITPEQVQIFTPTPSTWSSLMYCTGMDPFTGERLFVEKNRTRKEKQKKIISES